MPRYIAYCRKSRDEADKQVLSIEAQIAEITEFAKREHLDIIEFVTESKTAKCPGREKFGEVIKKIEHGVADGIIAWHADRLARNSVDGGRLIYLLDTGKLIDLKFPTLWFENTPQGKFMLSIAFGQSKYYVDNLSENVKRGLRQKIRNGVWPGKAPYGYINNPRTRGIDLEPVQSRAIKRAFQLFASGGSGFTDLARYLKKFGLTRKNGNPLHINEIRQILTNKFYIGVMHYQDEYHEGKHEQFISHDLFKRVQEELARRSRSKQKSHRFDFVGLAKCGHCGAAITAEEHTKYYKTTNHRATYVYYRCTRKMGVCHQPAITHQDFAQYLQGLAANVAIPESWGEEWQSLLTQDEQQAKLESTANVATLEKTVAEIDQKLNTLLDSYLESVVDPATYKHKKQELSENKQELVEQIAVLRDKGAEWVEPFRDLIMCAISSHKIARAKNNGEELSSFAKRVGLNFILEDRRLRGELKRGYTALQAGRGAWSTDNSQTDLSRCVVAEGHELIGIDVSKVMIELARRAVPAGSYCVREMRSMRVGEYSASAIICLYSLFHIPRTEHLQMLKIFAGNLEPRGYLLITMGDVEYEGEHEMYGVLSYSSQWSRTKNRMIVELAGYKVISDELERSGGECHQMILARKK